MSTAMLNQDGKVFNPRYDVIPDQHEPETFEKYVLCDTCEFFCAKKEPELWEEHHRVNPSHDLMLPPVPVHAAGAVPVDTVNAIPVPVPKFHCRTCHDGFMDLKTLRAHRIAAHGRKH